MKRIILDGKESNYIISENGEVFNTFTNKELRGSITESGYKYFRLSYNGKKFRFYAHRLVAEYYLPNEDSSKIVNHKNGNKLDNNIRNLEWVSHSENNIHANKTGLRIPSKKKRETFDLKKDSYKDEIWKSINNYSNYYISSYGRVYSQKASKPILLKPTLVNGYYKVVLSEDGVAKDELVAYLVYFNFHQERRKENYVIDHIDGDKTNNKLSNLRYISRSENAQAAYYLQHLQKNKRTVICYKGEEEVGIYPSIKEAARQLNCDGSAISKCCRGKYSNHHGYIFQYQ